MKGGNGGQLRGATATATGNGNPELWVGNGLKLLVKNPSSLELCLGKYQQLWVDVRLEVVRLN